MLKSGRSFLLALALCGMAFAQQPAQTSAEEPALPPGYAPSATMTMEQLNSRADVVDEAEDVADSSVSPVSEGTDVGAKTGADVGADAAVTAADSKAPEGEDSTFHIPVVPVVISALGTIAFVVLAIIF